MSDEKNAQGILHHKRTITISTIYSTLAVAGVILPLLGALSFPWFVNFMSSAMAGEIKNQVKVETSPTREGVKAILQDKIDELSAKVAVLEARRDRDRQRWTDADAIELSSAAARLKKQQQALADLERKGQ